MKSFKDYLLENSIDDVHSYAKEKGINLEIDTNYDKNAYHLSWMNRKSNTKGAGRDVMNKLHNHADKNKKEIHLVAHKSHPKLVKYYSSMGYQSHGETDDGTHMVRKPKR